MTDILIAILYIGVLSMMVLGVVLFFHMMSSGVSMPPSSFSLFNAMNRIWKMNAVEIEQSLRDAIVASAHQAQQHPTPKFSLLGSSYPEGFWSREYGMEPKFDMDFPIVERLQELVEKRRAFLDKMDPSLRNDLLQSKGRLFISRFRQSLFDTAPECVTSGLIDPGEIPSWDTWVTVRAVNKEAELIAWIPEAWVDLVKEAIDAGPMGNILWLNEADESYQDIVITLRKVHGH